MPPPMARRSSGDIKFGEAPLSQSVVSDYAFILSGVV